MPAALSPNQLISIQSVLALVKEALLILDTEYRIFYINEKAKLLIRHLYGPINCCEGANIYELIPAKRRPALKGIFRKCLSGQSFEYDLETVADDDTVLWINCRFSPLVEEEKVRGLYLMLEDVSLQRECKAQEQKRKAAEEKFDRARTLFEMFMEHAPLRAWITDRQGTMHYMNSLYKQAFDILPHEKTKSLFELFPPAWVQSYLKEIQKVLEGNQPSVVTDKGRRSKEVDGLFKFIRFPLEVRGELMVAGWAIDITEQVELQKRLLTIEKNKKRQIVRSIIDTQEKERRLLSVELHDNVNQILSSCKLMLEAAAENKEAAEWLTDKCYQGINRAISEIRNISHELNPSAVEDIGLADAITDMMEKINRSGKLCIKFVCKGCEEASLETTDKIAVYRIVQEGVNNILKHARATQVVIHLIFKESRVFLKIDDNGRGFNLERARKGVGLKSIQHRIEYYQGKFKVRTAPGKGCQMRVILTVPQKQFGK